MNMSPRNIMPLPKIVTGSDTRRLRCKFERRLLPCFLVPPEGCSRSCEDTASDREHGSMAHRSSRGARVPSVKAF